jgi:DNA-binding winged helix-turn-helix (wHTH) protein
MQERAHGNCWIGEWSVSPAVGEISRGAQVTRLDPRLMRLLLFVAECPGEVVSVSELLQGVWSDVVVTPDSVYEAIAALRHAFGDHAKSPAYIVTLPRRGYRLIAPVRWSIEAAAAEPEPSPAAGGLPGRGTLAQSPVQGPALRRLYQRHARGSVRSARPHRIGYARLSGVGGNLDAQLDALTQAGCSKCFSDKMTGSRIDRPGWDQLMTHLRPGDSLVVAELSRLTRSLLDLLETGRTLEERDIHLVSFRENIDTGTATGRCFMSMMGAIHQMERELMAERAAAGQACAKARGGTGGRPRTPSERLDQARGRCVPDDRCRST